MRGSSRTSTGRRFLRAADPRGRDILVWVFICVATSVRLAAEDGQARGWRLWINLLLLAAGLVGSAVAVTRLRRFRGTSAPEDCPTCGHVWAEHGVDDTAGVCEGCALEIEYGVAPRIAGGCRLTRPVEA